MDRWFPVARSAEVVPRHVAQSQLLGQEIALWRSDAGVVNAWHNRCPHRGVRLSIGINTGTEIRCQYHAWRFASGSGQCTLIPAHPNQKPASSIHVGVYRAVERYGFVWVNLEGGGERDAEGGPDRGTQVPQLSVGDRGNDTTLRSIFVNAPAVTVAAALVRGYEIEVGVTAAVAVIDDFLLTTSPVVFLLQPVTQAQTIIHGLLQSHRVSTNRIAASTDRMALLRYHNARMSALRDRVEG